MVFAETVHRPAGRTELTVLASPILSVASGTNPVVKAVTKTVTAEPMKAANASRTKQGVVWERLSVRVTLENRDVGTITPGASVVV